MDAKDLISRIDQKIVNCHSQIACMSAVRSLEIQCLKKDIDLFKEIKEILEQQVTLPENLVEKIMEIVENCTIGYRLDYMTVKDKICKLRTKLTERDLTVTREEINKFLQED